MSGASITGRDPQRKALTHSKAISPRGSVLEHTVGEQSRGYQARAPAIRHQSIPNLCVSSIKYSQRGTLLLPSVSEFVFNYFANQLDSVYSVFSKEETTEILLCY